MRLSSNRKVASPWDRTDERKKARTAAATLRVVCPEAALVRVELAFEPDSQLTHAPQAFSVYPPAKAHFVYACPFGDCDGMYDLNEAAFSALRKGEHKARGKLICAGHRSRDGKSNCPCELGATYSISIRREG
jgi:hypothetical protein